jgi:multiple sugar transport system permease protein
MKCNIRFHKATSIMWYIFRAALLIGISFILLFPIIYMVSISFRPVSEVTDPSIIWIPKTFTLENLKMVFDFMKYPEALMNTLSIGIFSSFLEIVSCAFIGYGFARFRFREREILFAMVIFTILVPPQTLAIPSYLLYKNFDVFGILKIFGLIAGQDMTINLLDTRWVFYLPSILGVGLKSGLFIFIFRQFFKGMSKELEDAAYIDGCGALKTFLSVILPNASGALLTVFLFSVVWHWNDYYNAAMYLTNTRTLAVALASLRQDLQTLSIQGDPYQLVTRLQTGSLLTVLPLLAMYVALQRYFTESIERTGIVG